MKFFAKILIGLVIAALFMPIFFAVTAQKAEAQLNAESAARAVCEVLGLTGAVEGAALGAAGIAPAVGPDLVTEFTSVPVTNPVTDENLITVLHLIRGQAEKTSKEQTVSKCERFARWSFDILLTTIKRRLLDVIVDQIIVWIQGGGAPRFVSDWSGFLSDAGNEIAGEFIRETGAGFLCQPFSLRLQVGLLPVPKFSERARCTLDQITGNIENFYNDFRNGRWLAFSTALQPQNNFFGAIILAQEEADIRITKEIEGLTNKVLSGGGFLGTRKCDEDPENPGGFDHDGDRTGGDILSTCKDTTPGGLAGHAVKTALIDTEFDFIVNAQDLSAYAAAIANAGFNRLIAEGAGLLGVSAPAAPSGGVISSRTFGACVGLASPALETCISAGATSTQGAIAGLLAQLDESLAPREQAQLSIGDSIAALTNYLPQLEFLRTQFSGLTCPAVNTYISDINNEIRLASSTLTSLTAEQSRNTEAIGWLNRFKTDARALPEGDWTVYAELVQRIQVQGVLNKTAAESLARSATNQRDAISANISQKLPLFNQQLAQCQAES